MENELFHLDLCRICLLDPVSNPNMSFFPIFGDDDSCVMIRHKITEMLNINIERNDVKPKMICSGCHESILAWSEMKIKAAESQTVVNFIAKTRFGLRTPSQMTLNNTGPLPDLKNNIISTTTPQPPLNCESVKKISNISKTGQVLQSNSYTAGSNQQDCLFNQTFPANHSTPVSAPESNNAFCQHENNFNLNPSDDYIVHYCSICKAIKTHNHKCSAYNRYFCTCVVPNCIALFRNMEDFDQHYRQHMGFSNGEWICNRCFKENKTTERDADGLHKCRFPKNVFECCICYVTLDSMAEFASHKLKKHNGRLMSSNGHFLCFYCEKTSKDTMYIEEHMKQNHYKKYQSSQKNVVEQEITHNKRPKVSETIITTNDKIVSKETINPGVKRRNPGCCYYLENSEELLLLTCLKPHCNLIFQDSLNFQQHYHQHFKVGYNVTCWKCFSNFETMTAFKRHQAIDDCQTLKMFQCHECSEVFEDIQCLSIHKFTIHQGVLFKLKMGQKKITCPSCKLAIIINDFRSHLLHCYTPANKNSK